MSNDHQDTDGFRSPRSTVQHRVKPPSSTSVVETNPTPESRMAVAIGHAISSIRAASFQEAMAAQNTLIRTISNVDSSLTQVPKIPEPPRTNNKDNPLRVSLSDSIAIDYQQQKRSTNETPRRAVSDPTDYQQRLKKVEDTVREIKQRCLDIIPNPNEVIKNDQDERVRVKRLKNGDSKFELGCSCGKRFEMVLKQNGHCFYKLT